MQPFGLTVVLKRSYCSVLLQFFSHKLIVIMIRVTMVKCSTLRLSITKSDVWGLKWSVLVAWGWGNLTKPRKIAKKFGCRSSAMNQQRFSVINEQVCMLDLSLLSKLSYRSVMENLFSLLTSLKEIPPS